jgi:hypothetical protein
LLRPIFSPIRFATYGLGWLTQDSSICSRHGVPFIFIADLLTEQIRSPILGGRSALG